MRLNRVGDSFNWYLKAYVAAERVLQHERSTRNVGIRRKVVSIKEVTNLLK